MTRLARVLLALCLAACEPAANDAPRSAAPVAPSAPVRLASLATPDRLRGAAAETDAGPRSEWRFDEAGDDPQQGFRVLAGIEGLAVGESGLRGRTTAPAALLRVDYAAEAHPEEPLHAVEVRLSASAGEWLRYRFVGAEPQAPPPVLLADLEAVGRVRLQPGDVRTYTIPAPLSVPRAVGMRTLLLSRGASRISTRATARCTR